jgi:hypothetical protein
VHKSVKHRGAGLVFINKLDLVQTFPARAVPAALRCAKGL